MFTVTGGVWGDVLLGGLSGDYCDGPPRLHVLRAFVSLPDASPVLFTGIGPVLGLLFIPLIGSASDDCNSSYGRRRPFIWLLSLGVLLALVIIPHADVLAARSAWGGPTVQVWGEKPERDETSRDESAVLNSLSLLSRWAS